MKVKKFNRIIFQHTSYVYAILNTQFIEKNINNDIIYKNRDNLNLINIFKYKDKKV